MKWFPPRYYLNSNRALAIAWNDCSILSTATPTSLTPARAWNRMQTCNTQSLVAASSASAYTGGRSRTSPNPLSQRPVCGEELDAFEACTRQLILMDQTYGSKERHVH